MEYEFLKHTADIKFKAYGKTIEECFKNAAIATINSFCDEKIEGRIKKTLKINGKDFENLLYNFLEEFLFLFDSEQFVLSNILDIKIDKDTFELVCEASGDTKQNLIKSHIKAVTYSEMYVKKEEDKWVCQVVLDV